MSLATDFVGVSLLAGMNLGSASKGRANEEEVAV